ncbi:MAG: hypothetical protein A2Y33_08340 [Spirochaetes bacterium GWF1_51_8]|nr:MAG: hypothetical protein A2Y33_08340 [Spirochaetes bacterium GWF1_51_8]
MNYIIWDIIILVLCVTLILYFRRRDKRNAQLSTLKGFVQMAMNNIQQLFSDKERDLRDKTINLDISLKKLDKASEFINKRLADIKDFFDKTTLIHSELKTNMQSAQVFNQDIVSVRDQLKEIGSAVNEIDALKRDMNDYKKQAGAIRNEVEQARVWAQDNLGDFVKRMESEIENYRIQIAGSQAAKLEKMEADLSKAIDDGEYKAAKIEERFGDVERRMEEFDAQYLKRLDSIEGEVSKRIDSVEGEYQNKVSSIEQRFLKMAQEIDTAEKKFKTEAEQLFHKAGTDIQKTVDLLKKEAESSASSRVSTIDERMREEIKKLEERVNQSIRGFNENLNNTAKGIGDLNNRLTGFIKDSSDKFKGELNALKTNYTVEATGFFEKLDDRENQLNAIAKELTLQMGEAGKSIRKLTDDSTNAALDKIKSRETEILGNLEKSSDIVSDRLVQLEKFINSFESDITKKVSTMESELIKDINDSKNRVEELRNIALKLEKDIDNTITHRTKEIDSYMERLKDAFIEDYKALIDNTKDEIIGLRDEVKELQDGVGSQKDRILNGVKESVDSLKNWSIAQLGEIKDDIEGTKLRADGALVDVKEDVERNVVKLRDDLKNKLDSAIRDGELTLNAKKEEIKRIAGEMVREFDDKEREMGRKMENFQQAMEASLAKANGRIESARTGLETEVTRTTERLREEFERQIKNGEKLREELAGFDKLIADIKSTSESNISKIREKYQDVKDSVQQLEANVENTRKRIDENISTYINSIYSQMESEKSDILAHITKERDNAKDLIGEFVAASRDQINQRMEKILGETESNIKNLDGKAQNLLREFFDQRKADFQKEIGAFRESFFAPADDIISQFNKKAESMKTELDGELGEIKDDYRSFMSRLDEITSSLKGIEDKTLGTVQTKAVNIETEITNKLNMISHQFDGYIRKSETELKDEMDKARGEVKSLFGELKLQEEKMKNVVLDDVRNLTKKIQEIETRYDQMIKKTGLLERAEDMSQKAEQNMAAIRDFLHDLEEQRREIDKAMRDVDTVKNDNKTIQAMMNETIRNRKEAVAIKESVDTALEKARDIERLLDVIKSQQEQAESVKKVLVDTLNMYDDIKMRVNELEGKKTTINDLLETIDRSTDTIETMREKVNTVEDKVSVIMQGAKRLEDEIRTAQRQIDDVFKSQDEMSDAISKVTNIESLLIHIEEEEKKVRKLQEWIGRTQNDLEGLKEMQETIQADNPAASKKKPALGDDETTKNVLRLYEKGWGVDEIARSLKLSPRYVEIIIERYAK